MSSPNGLAFCSSDFGDPFCITKFIQFSLSSVLFLIIAYDLIIRYKKQRQINFFVIVSNLMLLSLLCNMVFSMDHALIIFNNLQAFFFNLYFAFIVYYVSLKVLSYRKPSSNYQIFRMTLHIGFSIYVLFLISGLIQRSVNYNSCKELWYLIVNGIGLGMSIILVLLGVYYTRHESKKLEGITNPSHKKNPIPNVWRWIFVNIFSQLCSLIESLIFELIPNSNCSFSSNYSTDEALKLIFAIISFHLGMIATIVFFRKKYRDNQGGQENRQRKQSITIQLTQQIQH